MSKTVNLFALQPGERARICSIGRSDKNNPIKQRLIDIGLIENRYVQCVLTAPFGNAKAFAVCASVIAIRKEDCQDIFVEK